MDMKKHTKIYCYMVANIPAYFVFWKHKAQIFSLPFSLIISATTVLSRIVTLFIVVIIQVVWYYDIIVLLKCNVGHQIRVDKIIFCSNYVLPQLEPDQISYFLSTIYANLITHETIQFRFICNYWVRTLIRMIILDILVLYIW